MLDVARQAVYITNQHPCMTLWDSYKMPLTTWQYDVLQPVAAAMDGMTVPFASVSTAARIIMTGGGQLHLCSGG